MSLNAINCFSLSEIAISILCLRISYTYIFELKQVRIFLFNHSGCMQRTFDCKWVHWHFENMYNVSMRTCPMFIDHKRIQYTKNISSLSLFCRYLHKISVFVFCQRHIFQTEHFSVHPLISTTKFLFYIHFYAFHYYLKCWSDYGNTIAWCCWLYSRFYRIVFTVSLLLCIITSTLSSDCGARSLYLVSLYRVYRV